MPTQIDGEDDRIDCDYCGEEIESLLDLVRDETKEFYYHRLCYLKLESLGQISERFMEPKTKES